MQLKISSYLDQVKTWPQKGNHILAQYDDNSIIVYQAYRSEIADYAVCNGLLGGEFSYNRMSWIKPNFLWMMYRSGWGTKSGQESVLAIRISRAFFDGILEKAVSSVFDPDSFQTVQQWKDAVSNSDVRLQWDPDHLPNGNKTERRAIQLGLRGEILKHYGRNPIEIINITDYVHEQKEILDKGDLSKLHTPSERVYIPLSVEAINKTRISV